MKKTRALALALACALSLSLLTACGGSGSGAASSGTDSAAGTAFKLGGTGPLTGGASIYGLAAQRGAQIAVDEINAQGGAIQFDLKYEDDQHDPEKAVNAYNALKEWGMQISLGSVTSQPGISTSALILWSSSPKIFSPIVGSGSQKIGPLTISHVTLVTIAACVVIMLALTAFTGRTKMGKAMRAVSEDKGAAQLMGINVNRTISMTFAIGSALAAIAGVLLCSAYPTLTPTTGSMPGIKAFTAAVFGGIGSIPGALLGGLLLGVIEIFAGAYISTQLSTAVVFGVLIVVLLVKPAGLLGKTVREKV